MEFDPRKLSTALFVLSLVLQCKPRIPEVGKTIEISELGLIFDYEGWTYGEDASEQYEYRAKQKSRSDQKKQDLKVLFYLIDSEENSKSGIRTSINFISEPIPVKYSKATLDDYVASMGALYSNVYRNYQMLSVPQKISLGNHKAALLEAKFLLESSGRETEIHTYQIVFLKEGSAYVISASTPETEFKTKGSKLLGTLMRIRGNEKP
ncbi:hypothetical protein EHO60_04230 [Leptospira fletcheri]|uniref:Lipoprotein n=1 Tax=Leptospira fletcheri TaxID=2484981 RepID=A0A4R9GFU3_9LEPT|nr:hypothetical protein [Leptospira fletcheri]TGK11520.1 hypothetical protein EHO60_04230 [Leptospira fletcheri]